MTTAAIRASLRMVTADDDARQRLEHDVHKGAGQRLVLAALTLMKRGLVAAPEVADDGVGGANASAGSGLRGLAGRLHAVGGTLAVDSRAGGGTTIRTREPLGSNARPVGTGA
jgi:signal transduction histidine kinase